MTPLPPAILCLTLAALAASQTRAEMTVDPRAVVECQAADPDFLAIETCLPGAHLGTLMLDHLAGQDSFGAAGQMLADRCRDRNDGVSYGAWVCAREVLEAAQRLSSMLPAGTVLDDPVFADLSRPDALARLMAVEAEVRATLPRGADLPFVYKPLK